MPLRLPSSTWVQAILRLSLLTIWGDRHVFSRSVSDSNSSPLLPLPLPFLSPPFALLGWELKPRAPRMLGSGSATELCLQARQINFRSFSFEAPVVLAEHVDETI